MNLFKKLFIPSGEQAELKALNSWMVRWKSIDYNGLLSYSKDETEVFTSKEDAEIFKDSLYNARKLLKDKSFSVKITEN